MNAEEQSGIETRLARILPGAEPVRITGVASLGAQRSTLFLEIGDGDSSRRAVAQIADQVIAATQVDIEADLLRAAQGAGVPVPPILAVDTQMGVVVSEHVEGETLPRRILRRMKVESNLGDRLTTDSGRALAAIHQIPSEALPRLDDVSDPLRYAAELEKLLDSLSAPNPSFRLGLRWLRQNAFEQTTKATLVHGDYRLGNIIVGDVGLAAVLDWELAHRGDPMEDLAWLCLRTWRFGEDAHEVGGFGALTTLREAYEDAGGVWREDAFDWWTVARTLWWGLGLARQTEAFLSGATDSIVLAASGRRVAELEYDLLRLIGP